MQRILLVLAMALGLAMSAPTPLSDHSAQADNGQAMAYDVLREASYVSR